MAQPSVASFFNTRKRAAVDDAIQIKNRRLIEPATPTSSQISSQPNEPSPAPSSDNHDDEISAIKAAASGLRTRSGRTVKRIYSQTPETQKKVSKTDGATCSTASQKKLVEFIKKGRLSPRKPVAPSPVKQTPTETLQKINEQTPSTQIISNSKLENLQKKTSYQEQEIMKTPTKQIIKGSTPIKPEDFKKQVKKELNFDEVKTKISRSAKLSELKASLARIQELEKTRKAQEEHNRRLREGLASPAKKAPVVQLKEFKTIELEVLTSPAKTFKTPTKLPPPTPDKNELMSPRHTDVSKKLLFSPSKNGSPSKLIVPPAYQRFMNLAETSTAGKLQIPFKYRNLLDIFRGLDSVCAMFHNRKECITFKKLKPAVQRMLRKNFTEQHLAQIKHLYPDAFNFTQMKMRNYGSISKADYFQLVITPNVENNDKSKMSKIDEDDILGSASTNSMNPQVMTERVQRFHKALLDRVKEEHEKFLKSLDPPLIIPKEKVTRWHPDFDLEKCPDIELGHLPQPPNVEKYSSAKDILSTARNLFNCSTPMERVMERYEAKLEADKAALENKQNATKDQMESKGAIPGSLVTQDSQPSTPTTPTVPAADATSSLLKGVPKSLLEKIRAKQAAKALDAMTRRPSQDQEATKYSRLPELARHLRNVFITERKGVLTLELVIKKIQNSYRTSLTPQEIEAHLKLMAKEVSEWVAFHEVRKTMYVKIAKDMDLTPVIQKLEHLANEKSK